MAQRYPTYNTENRTSLARPVNIDRADLREAQKSANAMSTGANQIMDFAFGKMEQKAKIQGQEYGATNPQEAMKATKGQDTIFDQYAYGAAVKAASAQVETEARNEMGKTLLEWKNNKGTPEALQSKLHSINAGFSNAMGDMDAVSAMALNETLTRLSNSVYLDYTEDWMKDQKASLKTKTYEGIEQRHQAIEIMARQNISPEMFNENLAAEINSLTGFMEGTDQTPKEIAGAVLTMQKRAHKARVRGAFKRSEDKVGFLNEFQEDLKSKKGLARGLADADSISLISEMNTKINSVNKRTKAIHTALDKDFAALEKIAIDGLNPGNQLSELKKEAELAGYGMLYMQIEQLEANYENYYRPAREMNPEGLQREINKIQKMQSADGEVTDAERVLVENLEKILTDISGDRKDEEKSLDERFVSISKIVADGQNPGLEKIDALLKEAKELNYESMVADLEDLKKSTGVLQRARQMSQEALQGEINTMQREMDLNENVTDYDLKLLSNLEGILADKKKERKDEDEIINDAMEILSKGYGLDEEMTKELNDIFSRYKDDEIRDKLKNAVEAMALFEEVEDYSVKGIDQAIDKYQDQLDQIGANKNTLDVMEGLEEMRTKMVAALDQDPMAWAKKTREDFPELSYIEDANGNMVLDKESVKARVKWAKGWAGEMGIETTFFSDQDKKGMIAYYNSVGKDKKIAMIGNITETFGSDALEAFREIHGTQDGRNLAHVGALSIGGNPYIVEDALRGYELAAEDVQVYFADGSTAKNTMDENLAIVMSGVRFPPHLMGSITSTAKHAYMARHIDKGLTDFDEEIWQEVLQESAGALIMNGEQYGGIITFDPDRMGKDHQLMIPNNIKAENFENIIERINPELFEHTTGAKLHYINRITQEVIPFDISTDDKWEDLRDRFHFSNVDGDNVYLSLEPTTHYDPNRNQGVGFFVDANGENIVLNLRELANKLGKMK